MLRCSCTWTVRRAFRRSLYLAGGAQVFTAQIATAALMGLAIRGAPPPLAPSSLSKALVYIFTIGFAYSHGPLDWLVSCPPASCQTCNALWLSMPVHRTVRHAKE